MITKRKHDFLKERSYQTSFILLSDRETKTIVQENAIDIVYLNFSKAFNTILVEKIEI